VGLAVLYGAYCLALQANGNFHTVVPGEMYRSAQPSGEDVAAYAARYGIRSIINLRGENAQTEWYREEVAASQSSKVQHFDFRMSANHELTPDRAQELVAMMRNAPKPVLIHCMHGADRSGLAAALYMAVVKKQPGDKAGDQLSMLYGHLPFSFARGYEMTTSFERLKSVFGY
jgi:protein tyrosine/serine phosphatase